MTFKMIEEWWGRKWILIVKNYKGQVVQDPNGNGFYWNVEEDGEIVVSGCEPSPFEAMGYIRATITTYSGGEAIA